MHRRNVLRTGALGVTGLFGGCLGSSGWAGDSATTTKRARTAVRTQRECDSASSTTEGAGGGGAPPWFDPENPVDIVVSNGTESDVSVVLTIGEARKGVRVPSEGYWSSEDLIEDGARPVITVETEGLQQRVKWHGERDNMAFVVFVVEKTEITASFGYKSCPE
jgi:hypothetical protein